MSYATDTPQRDPGPGPIGLLGRACYRHRWITIFVWLAGVACLITLWTRFGAPAQDKWIAKHKDELDVPLSMGVGGSFDFVAGVARRAPVWVQRAGLEWLHRLWRQPWRARRIFTAVVEFPLAVLLAGGKSD